MPEQSALRKLYKGATTPLTTAPSRIAGRISDKLSMPHKDMGDDFASQADARFGGFLGGAAEGIGNLASGMTSPLSIALTLAGAGPFSKLLRGGGAAAAEAPAMEGALSSQYAGPALDSRISGLAPADIMKTGNATGIKSGSGFFDKIQAEASRYGMNVEDYIASLRKSGNNTEFTLPSANKPRVR